MATTAKQLTPLKSQPDWKHLAGFTLAKLTENIYDMVITIVVLGLLLSYLLTVTPEMAVEYGGYIIALYVLLLVRRIVHDFDESWTLDEIGERLIELDERIAEYQRLVAIEMTDDEIEQRINGRP